MNDAAGFWMVITSTVVAVMWKDSRAKAEERETLRRIIEKAGTIDEVKIIERSSDPPCQESKPGEEGSRRARVTGAIVLSVAAAMATFVLVAALLGYAYGITGMFNNITGLIAGLAI